MYSRFSEFSNLDLYSCQDLDNIGSLSPDFFKVQDATICPEYTQEQSMDFFFQKSSQNLVGSYEISFEKNFMKEHQAVFERQLQNYMESFRIYKNKTGKDIVQQEYLAPSLQDKYFNCQLFIKANSSAFQCGDIESLVSKLEQYEKLNQFLDVVVASCHKVVAVELIQIAQQLLEKYEKVRIEGPSEAELLELASEVSKCPEAVELTNLKGVSLQRGREASELLEKSKKFMSVYCATAMLVIAQYFENPYSDEEGGFKRPLSPWSLEDDQQEEVAPVPIKKRKFSF